MDKEFEFSKLNGFIFFINSDVEEISDSFGYSLYFIFSRPYSRVLKRCLGSELNSLLANLSIKSGLL